MNKLPEFWQIKRTSENHKVINEWMNNHHSTKGAVEEYSDSNFFVNNKNKNKCNESSLPIITFEQFKEFVLKEQNMENKEIIGAFCIKDFPNNRFGTKSEDYTGVDFMFDSISWNEYQPLKYPEYWKIKYKEEIPDIKEGDYIYIINVNFESDSCYDPKYNGDILKVTSFQKEKVSSFPNAYWLNHTPKSFSGGGFRVDKSAWQYGINFRKATAKEIEEYENNLLLEEAKRRFPDITINGYKGEFFDHYVKFGCVKIHKDIFEELDLLNKKLFNGNGTIGRISNKEIESVTIGKGTFSKNQIKEISEYYLNNKDYNGLFK